MSAAASCMGSADVPLGQVEAELSRRLHESNNRKDAPMLRARLSNLVIFCQSNEQAEVAGRAVPEIVSVHPARVLLLVGEPTPDVPLQTSIQAWRQVAGKQELCSEQITMRAAGKHVDQLAFGVRELLIGDLPTNLWWCPPVPPPLAGQLLYDLAEYAQQIVYDSIGWAQPARGVVATSAWLPKVHSGNGKGPWRVAADLNWRRLKVWRRLLSQALDPNTAPGALESISEVVVEHGPHAVIQAWELVSWLASRLGWQVEDGNVQPGVEVTWQLAAAHGNVRVRLRRLAEGPSEIRIVRISCLLEGEPHALNVTVQNGMQLAVVLEGLNAQARTVAVKPTSLSELIVRQISDRERDPVFQESMALAEVFARTVLE